MRVRLGRWQPNYWHTVIRLNPTAGAGWTACGTSFSVSRDNKVRRFWWFWGTKMCPKCWDVANPWPTPAVPAYQKEKLNE